jgi:hypothetical protein
MGRSRIEFNQQVLSNITDDTNGTIRDAVSGAMANLTNKLDVS